MKRWDIFCKVIDNYGDAGVTWRLARQLVGEYQQNVRLWVDDLTVLSAIVPDIDAHAQMQRVASVTIMHWTDALDASYMDCADIVIEAFACHAPPAYIDGMKQRVPSNNAPIWLNLEYLTAEPWAAGCHLLPSPQAGGLIKVFFFPGFGAQTGGLLREQSLLERRDALNSQVIWQKMTGFEWHSDAFKISLFGYEHMRLRDWLPCLIASEQPIQLAITHGQATEAFHQAWRDLGLQELEEGALSVRLLPMLAQDAYDELLMSSDFNCVRGEDSWVRAIWAAQPFVWHIYAQDDGAHVPKLEAFIQDYTAHIHDDALAQAWGNWLRVWNGDARYDFAQSWAALLNHWPKLQTYAHVQSTRYAQTEDLAQQLMRYCAVEGGNEMQK